MTAQESGGVSLEKLARICGTPLQVYDEEKIEHQLNAAVTNFRSPAFDTQVVYASKAFSCTALLKIVEKCGAGLDAVSGGELFTANKAGMNMKNIYFHGNNKSKDEIDQALMVGCGTIVLDNIQECETVTKAADKAKKDIDLLLRVNPGIEAHTHKYIMTAHLDSKFGISIDKKDDIEKLVAAAGKSNYTHFKGFHIHIGSQITETESFEKAIEVMAGFIDTMNSSYGISTDTLSLGGGFGIRYNTKDRPLSLGAMCKRMISKCESVFKGTSYAPKKLVIEPGRSIVGEAGVTLYTIGYRKNTHNKKYVFVDGGMSDNIRPALYEAEYSCDILGKENEKKTETVCVAGKNCESGDILIKETQLPSSKQGDILIVYATGAYGYSMASNYNKLGRPAVVFAKDGKARIVIKRETYMDMIRLETDEKINI